MPRGDLSLGIDLGGSHISLVISDEKGNISERLVVENADRNPEHVLTLMREKAKNILCKYPSCVSVGIGIPGNIDPIAGTTRYLPNFGWMEPVPVTQILDLKLPIAIRNDGRCHAFAESKLGCGRTSKIFAMLTLGTGIGGALIANGVLFDGCSFDAGDFGHHIICSGSDAFACSCGKRGCFETQASADGLIRHYQRESARSFKTVLPATVTKAKQVIELMRSQSSDGTASTAATDSSDDADGSKAIAIRAFKRFREDLSTGIANLVTFYNPDTIALGGGLALAPEVFAGLVEQVDSKTLPAIRGKLRIVPASLGVDAGAIGAALVGLFDHRERTNELSDCLKAL